VTINDTRNQYRKFHVNTKKAGVIFRGYQRQDLSWVIDCRNQTGDAVSLVDQFHSLWKELTFRDNKWHYNLNHANTPYLDLIINLSKISGLWSPPISPSITCCILQCIKIMVQLKKYPCIKNQMWKSYWKIIIVRLFKSRFSIQSEILPKVFCIRFIWYMSATFN